MNFRRGVHVFCWEVGVFNRSCVCSVSCKRIHTRTDFVVHLQKLLYMLYFYHQFNSFMLPTKWVEYIYSYDLICTCWFVSLSQVLQHNPMNSKIWFTNAHQCTDDPFCSAKQWSKVQGHFRTFSLRGGIVFLKHVRL